MTESNDFELLALAAPYAIDAVTDDERKAIERQVRDASNAGAEAFRREVRDARETMSAVSPVTALEPPVHLRPQVLAVATSRHLIPWHKALLVAAAAVLIGLGSVGIGLALRPAHTQSTADLVFTAPDVHTVSAQIPGGGTATVIFSRQMNAGMLVLNDVAKPKAGTVYQMWLINDLVPTSAGTIDAHSVSPSTTAALPDLRHSSALAFTIEPGSGSAEPTTSRIATLSLT